MPVRETDVFLVEDGHPLERRAVEALAGRAVAVLGRQGPVTAELVLDAAAVALPSPLYGEIFFFPIFTIHVVALLFVGGRRDQVASVRGPVLPRVFFAVRGRACLVLVWFFGRLTTTTTTIGVDDFVVAGFFVTAILLVFGRHFERIVS